MSSPVPLTLHARGALAGGPPVADARRTPASGTGLADSGVDRTAVRAAAVVRVLTASAVGGGGSFVASGGRPATFAVLVALGYLPLAVSVLFACDRPSSRWAVAGGPIADALVLGTAVALLPGRGSGLIVLAALVVAFASYTWLEVPPWVPPALVVAAVSAGQLALPAEDRLPLGAASLAAAVLLALAWLGGRMRAQHARAREHGSLMAGRAAAVLSRVAEAIVVTDARGTVLEHNPAAADLLQPPSGAAHCHAFLGLREGEAPLDCSTSCELLALARTNGGHGVEVWRALPDGRRQPMLASAATVSSPDGTGVEVVHSLRDVTRLKQSDEAKTLFLAMASHELKTPLTVIAGFADTLAKHPDLPRADVAEAVATIHRRAAELTKIVDRLLLSSRIEAGQLAVRPSPVLLGPVVEERVRAVAATTGRDVRAEVPGGLPAALGDCDAVTTVIDHLLDNAVKYSPDGGAIRVGGRAEGGWVVLVVTDEGIGMDTEEAAHCFDKFWQAESTDVRRFGGTGIGLYIVRSMVESMGGQVAVRSRPGAGCSIEVRLRAQNLAVPEQPRTLPLHETSMIREFMSQIGVPAERG